MEDLLTFEELRRAESKERNKDTLQELDEDFFERARDYLEHKKQMEDPLENKEYRNARNVLQEIIDRRQRKIVRLAFLSVKSNVHVENLLEREQELFREIEETIGSFRHDLLEEIFENEGLSVPGKGSEDEDGTSGEVEEEVEESEEPEEKSGKGKSAEDSGEESEGIEDAGKEGEEGEDPGEGGLARVRALTRIPEFMGTDLEAYGPIEEGEEVSIPEKNAKVLEDQDKAERLD